MHAERVTLCSQLLAGALGDCTHTSPAITRSIAVRGLGSAKTWVVSKL
jgi:hypothetical protein